MFVENKLFICCLFMVVKNRLKGGVFLTLSIAYVLEKSSPSRTCDRSENRKNQFTRAGRWDNQNRRGKIQIKPLAVYKYNQFMSSVDKNKIKLGLIIYARIWQTNGLVKRIGIHFFFVKFIMYFSIKEKLTGYDYRLFNVYRLCLLCRF